MSGPFTIVGIDDLPQFITLLVIRQNSRVIKSKSNQIYLFNVGQRYRIVYINITERCTVKSHN